MEANLINSDQYFVMVIDYFHKNPITFAMLSALFSWWLKIVAARHPDIDDNKIRTLLKKWFLR